MSSIFNITFWKERWYIYAKLGSDARNAVQVKGFPCHLKPFTMKNKSLCTATAIKQDFSIDSAYELVVKGAWPGHSNMPSC